MVLASGGFGIWWFIDIILSLTGELKDKSGIKVKNEGLSFFGLFKPIGILLLISGSSGLVAFAYTFSTTKSFKDSAIITTGSVFQIREALRDGTTYYYSDFKFTDKYGNEHRIRSSVGSNPPKFMVGDKVEVLYPENKPRKAKLNTFFSLWGFSLIFGIIGVIHLLIGLVLLLVQKHTKSNITNKAVEEKFQTAPHRNP